MKQVLLTLVVIASVACNEGATPAEKAVDSSATVTIDSLKNATANPVGEADSTTNILVDSSKAGTDSTRRTF